MKTLTLFATVLILAGCNDFNMFGKPAAAPVQPPPQPPGDASYLAKSGVQGDGADGAVDSALELSKKNAQLSEELLRSQQQRYELEERVRTTDSDNQKLKSQLELAHKELSEANQMLVDMRRELEGWKTNVLGFREEMREAQKSQMEALRKVLILLGAEPTAQPTTSAAPGGSNAD